MNFTFNLISEKWIPCITSEGQFIDVSLRDLFAEAHEIREISCETPIQSAAILPLALAILHRNFGPASAREWGKLWGAGKFDMGRLDEYFEIWRDRFDLFHSEHPFYQSTVDGAIPSSLIHIVHTSANSPALFNHENELAGVKMPPAEAARQLLASRLFHTGGAGPSAGKGRGRYYFTDSPFARGAIFWARGKNLFETLLFNLIRYADEHPILNTAQDMPAWEMEDPFERREIPHGYLDYLTWSNNRIKLIPEMEGGDVYVREATVVPALELSKDFTSLQKRHNKVVKGKKTTYPPLRFTAEKALWRDYHTLLPRDDGDKLPAVIRWCNTLVNHEQLEDSHVIQLMATGMSTDPGKAKIYFYRREIMPLPLHVLRDTEKMNAVTNAINLAEDIARVLSSALHLLADRVMNKTLGNDFPSKEKKRRDERQKLMSQWNAVEAKRYSPRLYWIRLGQEFENFIGGLRDDSEQAMKTWSETLVKTAEESLKDAVRLAGSSPWVMKGKVEAGNHLYGQIKKLFEKKGIEVND